MRKLVSIIFLSTISLITWAIPASREPIIHYTEDGLPDTTYIYGDEYASFRSCQRNARVPRLASYAPQRQMHAAYVPTEGTVRVPVILVNFSDLGFTLNNPKTQFEDLFNGDGGSNPNATGSVRTYFTASSNGALDLEYEVFGPYTLSHGMAYYGDNKTNNSGVTTDHNIRASELVTEAVQLAYNAGVDFSRYDADSDGNIDNVSIVVAGYNEAEGGRAETIWPHYSVINSAKRFNNKFISGYLMISEYRGSGGGTQAGIGTYCHEFGHALGLPDLYDTSSSDAYTVGDWDVMCTGCYNNAGSTPPTYTAFERFVMGWLTPQQVTSSGLKTLQPIETSNEALLLAANAHNLDPLSPNPSEYFLLENRQALGWDAGKGALVSTGLLVSHITFNSYRWEYNTFNNSTPLGFAIVSAGMDVPTQSSAADVFPGSTKRTTWHPTMNDGTILNQRVVSQIRQRNDGAMAMYIGSGGDDMLTILPEELEVSTSFLTEPLSYDTAVATLHIPSTQQDSLLLYVESDRFHFSIDSGIHWYCYPDTACITIEKNRAYDLSLKVLYTPTRQNCTYTYSFLTVISPDESMGAQLTLKGISPKPTLVTTPIVNDVTTVSTHSFTVSWEDQEAAEGYYYALYTIEEGSSQETEDFETFATIKQIREHGWDANFANSQTTISESGNAVVFRADHQYIQTPVYPYTPIQISFWLSNNYTPNGQDGSQGGQLIISGSSDGTHWNELSKITVQRTTKHITRTIDIDTTLHMRQFRVTYMHSGGDGGTIMDTWRVHYPFNLHYLYAPRENIAYTNNIQFRYLTPNTAYYYTMQAYEESGCTPHYSAPSEPLLIRTKDISEEQYLIANRLSPGRYSVTLPDMSDEHHYLAVYDYNGHMLYKIRPAYGEIKVELPPLTIGQLYLVKYYSESIKRKDPNTKILCY